MKKAIAAVLILAMIFAALCVPSFAAGGSLFVNGEAFGGTLEEAIVSAGKNGTVTVDGTVHTEPLGKRGTLLIEDVTIEGQNNAKIILALDFVPHNDDNLDVITVKGSNVTIKNVLIDAGWRVDYPLNTFGGTNLVIENVTVQHGIRGGINVMTSGDVLFKGVTARSNFQAGFSLENCQDGSRLKFVDCETSGNWYRTGILICNGYADSYNIDASGITCGEGFFAVHDRCSGTISGGERAKAIYTAPPKDKNGNPIDTSVAMYYPLEKAYHSIRFGVSEAQTKSAVCFVDTTAYGFETRVYFDNEETARGFLHEGEQIVKTDNGASAALLWLLRIFNSLRINLF